MDEEQEMDCSYIYALMNSFLDARDAQASSGSLNKCKHFLATLKAGNQRLCLEMHRFSDHWAKHYLY